MVVHARTRTVARRALGAAAALALGTGLAAAGAQTAHATAGSSGVSSSVVLHGGALSVRSALAALPGNTYVESRLGGRLSVACFAGGQVVPGTGTDAGWVATGDLGGAPWYNNGYLVDAVAPAGATSVSAPVVLKNVLLDRAGLLREKACAPGQQAGFHRYLVTRFSSQRHAFDGTVLGTDSGSTWVPYRFPAPVA
ncbi:hypothetical protein [Kineococcus sp. SYSU DK002]|uniref:hypothetical protein n=1 Tax=Kineococcus sp. SYSU DK002 TaxID=3383123 RepID=UPI003D7F0849